MAKSRGGTSALHPAFRSSHCSRSGQPRIPCRKDGLIPEHLPERAAEHSFSQRPSRPTLLQSCKYLQFFTKYQSIDLLSFYNNNSFACKITRFECIISASFARPPRPYLQAASCPCILCRTYSPLANDYFTQCFAGLNRRVPQCCSGTTLRNPA